MHPLLLLATLGWCGGCPRDPKEDTSNPDTGIPIDPECTSGDSFTFLDMPFSRICPGTFIMGSTVKETDHPWSPRPVTLTRGFYVATTELTQLTFQTYMGYLEHSNTNPDGPVLFANWHEAAALTNALSAAEGLERCYKCTGTGPDTTCRETVYRDTIYECEGYRLPTVAEWEYAARAGTATDFYNGGNLVPGTEVACDGPVALDNGTFLDDIAWYCGNAELQPHTVATKAPNPWGLHDTAGNVGEWASDDIGPEYPEGPTVDPYDENEFHTKAVCSGDFLNGPANQTVWSHGALQSSTHEDQLGFRIARTMESYVTPLPEGGAR